MTLANFDLYYHMTNHYRKIREAKAVIDCSSPKGYNKNACSSKYVNNSCNSRTSYGPRKLRSCSPTIRPSDCCLVDYQRCFSAPTCKKPDWKDFVVTSGTTFQNKKEPKTPKKTPPAPNNENKQNKCCDKTCIKEKTRQKSEERKSPRKPSPKREKEVTKPKRETQSPRRNEIKTPTKQQKQTVQEIECKHSDCKHCQTFSNNAQESEYVHFLLKITEDILRNNLYTEKEMDKLFESHIKANKNRLNEKRMRDQIKQLKQELNLPLPPRDGCECKETESQSSKPSGSQTPKASTPTDKSNCGCENGADKQRDSRSRPKQQAQKPAKSPEFRNKSPYRKQEVNKKKIDITPVPKIIPPEKCKDPAHCIPSGQDQPLSTSNKEMNQKKIDITPVPTIVPPENCKDPVHCIPKGQDHPQTPPSTPSKVKVKNKNGESDETQMVQYTTPDSEDPCYCNVPLQRTALKIQVEDENEEYILVDGPVCMPRSMLETKTIPVLVQNASSMVINRFEPVSNQQNSLVSGVNLYQQSSLMETHEEEAPIQSISEEFKKEKAERDYDITPQRDTSLSDDNKPPETREKNVGCTPEDCPKKQASFNDDKYHYLLVDVATSVSNNHIGSPNLMSSNEVTKPTVEDNEYQRLMKEEYQVDNTPQNENEPQKVPDTQILLVETELAGEPLLTTSESEKSSDSGSNIEDDLIFEDEIMHDETEIKNEELPQEEIPYNISENSPPPRPEELMAQRPSILKTANFPSRHGEAPKVRYSLMENTMPDLSYLQKLAAAQNPGVVKKHTPLKNKLLDEDKESFEKITSIYEKEKDRHSSLSPEHLAIINQLDQLPEMQDQSNEHVTMNEKMKEFRTIDEEDAGKRRFQISKEDKFEIRRVSVAEITDQENEKNKEKSKTTCCWMGKKKGSFSSDNF